MELVSLGILLVILWLVKFIIYTTSFPETHEFAGPHSGPFRALIKHRHQINNTIFQKSGYLLPSRLYILGVKSPSFFIS